MFVWMYYDSFRQYLNSRGLFYLHFPVTTIAFLFAVLASYVFNSLLHMKAVGVALAMLTQMLACLVSIVIIALCFKVSREKLKPLSRASCRRTCSIARRGFPAFLMYFLDLISLEVMIIVSSFISTEHLAANTALVQLFYAVVVFGFGVQGSAGPLVGQAIGAGDVEKAKSLVRAAWVVGMAFIVLICSVYVPLAETISSIYTTDEQVLGIMAKSAPFVAMSLVLATSLLSLGSVVIGLGKQVLAGLVNPVIYLLIGIPLGLLLVFLGEMYEGGFWVGLSAAYLCINMFFYTLYKRTDYKRIV